MKPATRTGWAMNAVWDPSISSVTAPIRWAMNRSASGGMALSCCDTRNQLGLVFQAAWVAFSVSAASDSGRWVAYITSARSAEVLARSPRPVLRAFGADSYGRELLAAGDRSTALGQLDRAWDEYHRMGAWAWLADTQRVMREAGARRAKWSDITQAATGWNALTPAERRVALLIGTGHTNKSASTELGVSVNTVGTHLRSVFAKLNIQSRVQLANELHRADLT